MFYFLCPALLFAKISFTIISGGVLFGMKQIIIRYLESELRKSMIGYEVNGNPEKRLLRLKGLAIYQYNRLTTKQKYKLFIKILFRIIFGK